MPQILERFRQKGKKETVLPHNYNRNIDPAEGFDRERLILNCRELLSKTEFGNPEFLALIEYLIGLSGGVEEGKTTPHKEPNSDSHIQIVRKTSRLIDDIKRDLVFSLSHMEDVNNTWATAIAHPTNVTNETVREAVSPVTLIEKLHVQTPRYEDTSTTEERRLIREVHIPARMNIPTASGLLLEENISLLSQGNVTLTPECPPHILRTTSQRVFDAVVKLPPK